MSRKLHLDKELAEVNEETERCILDFCQLIFSSTLCAQGGGPQQFLTSMRKILRILNYAPSIPWTCMLTSGLDYVEGLLFG